MGQVKFTKNGENNSAQIGEIKSIRFGENNIDIIIHISIVKGSPQTKMLHALYFTIYPENNYLFRKNTNKHISHVKKLNYSVVIYFSHKHNEPIDDTSI